ncbi:MAG: LysR family transcriptional regulator [Spirochaetaceae bacterium]|nr:MAG: LysR family transcriptional regulator [Spirochaetaceae bacterium]
MRHRYVFYCITMGTVSMMRVFGCSGQEGGSMKTSAGNQLPGTVEAVTHGGVTVVSRELAGRVHAELRMRLESGELSAATLLDLLDGISQGQSLSAAARRLGCSYRHAWGVVTAATQELGARLVATTVGGVDGGGSQLTACGDAVRRELTQISARVDEILRSEPAAAQTGRAAGVERRNVPRGRTESVPVVFVAATLESVETGLLDAIGQAFYAETGVRLGHVAAGSGVALELARSGRVDLALTHAPELERAFVEQGWGEAAIRVMRSSFVIVGPRSDPAAVRDAGAAADPLDAMRRIARSGARFISRADRSGTHIREQALWNAAGVSPDPLWYRYCRGSGNRALLQQAAGEQAYTLVDNATVRRWGLAPDLAVLYRDPQDNANSAMADLFSILRVSSGVGSAAGYRCAGEFINWFEQHKYDIVRTAAVDSQGVALFQPCA